MKGGWSQTTLIWSAIVGILAWCGYFANIAYQTFYPFEIATFGNIVIPEQHYHPGDVVRYTVEVNKFYPAAATVVRTLECTKGIYNILPDLRGEAKTGHHVFPRNFVIPDDVKVPDTCFLYTVFSYDSINAYHKPIKYPTVSNTFEVFP